MDFKETLATIKEIVVISAIVFLMFSSCDAKRSNVELTSEVVRLQAVVQAVGDDVAFRTCELRTEKKEADEDSY